MRFKVPQFIEVEDKIFGPLTFKQFIYLVGGGGLCFTLWRFLPGFIAVFLVLPVAALSAALAFYRPNNRAFIDTLESAFKYSVGNKLYLWKHDVKKPQKKVVAVQGEKSALEVPKMAKSKLKDLAWELDIEESVYSEDTKPQ